jgi:hypothetical protein
MPRVRNLIIMSLMGILFTPITPAHATFTSPNFTGTVTGHAFASTVSGEYIDCPEAEGTATVISATQIKASIKYPWCVTEHEGHQVKSVGTQCVMSFYQNSQATLERSCHFKYTEAPCEVVIEGEDEGKKAILSNAFYNIGELQRPLLENTWDIPNQEYKSHCEGSEAESGKGSFSGTTDITGTAIADPRWHVEKSLLHGLRQAKLQTKGIIAFQSKAEGLGLTVMECSESATEGGTIEEDTSSYMQGQGKVRFYFGLCKLPLQSGCSIEEPFLTSQLKSHLVTYDGSQTKFADVFEPQEGEKMALIKLEGNCKGELALNGSIVGEFSPGETEITEAKVNFPTPPIETVFHDGYEEKPHLSFGGGQAKLEGSYSMHVVKYAKFGIFSN